jgi:4,5-dihydroxyphthalate decarboxylase
MATTKVSISFAKPGGRSNYNPFYMPLVNGSVVPRGIELVFQEDKGLENNTLRIIEGACDVAEMSIATFVNARANGAKVVALPVFPTRRFVQGMISVRSDSDLRDPSQLKGRKVGLHVYWQSQNVWARGMFRQNHGVEPKDIAWITNRPERLGTKCPPGVDVRQDRLGRDTAKMLLEKEVDAVFGLESGGLARAEMTAEELEGKTRVIYPDLIEAMRSYYRQVKIFPTMHVIGIREELASKQPSIVESLYDAFVAAKEHVGMQRGLEAFQKEGGLPLRGGTIQDTYDLLGEDPFPYDLKANRRGLEMFLTEAFHQGMIDRPLSVESIFPGNLPQAAQ